ncbi:CAP domain-containing protein [Murimonas intestini]|uniref:CAP domain-containing protein n=1 Tax=Murimonas intestini TaxID=1337051 RepID=UPI0011DC8F2C|nr:CAP domain-containing protein [Murimonas intestini]
MKTKTVLAMLSLTLAGILPLNAQAADTAGNYSQLNGLANGQIKVVAGSPAEVRKQLESLGIKCDDLGGVDCPVIQIPCLPQKPERPETPDTEKPETPDTELPEAPDTEGPETPDTDLPETPDTDLPEIPDTEKPETPDTELPEAPDTEKPETPDTDLPEIPDTEKPEAPDTESPETPDTDSSQSELSEFAREVGRLVNEERRKNGLGDLELRVDISAAAQVRAVETETSFSHTRPDGRSFSTALDDKGISYRMSGENIAWGQKTPEEVMKGWMNSEGHRANILNKNYTSIGVGYYQNARGVNYWTQIFTS